VGSGGASPGLKPPDSKLLVSTLTFGTPALMKKAATSEQKASWVDPLSLEVDVPNVIVAVFFINADCICLTREVSEPQIRNF
jgi:hypothetical protein